jgi:hypothetical protein
MVSAIITGFFTEHAIGAGGDHFYIHTLAGENRGSTIPSIPSRPLEFHIELPQPNEETEINRNMAFSSSCNLYFPERLWQNGPSPSGLLNFPGGMADRNTCFAQRSQ